MTVEEHESALGSLRHELGALREHGGISEQFVDWHRRLVVCLEVVASEFQGCAAVCAELRTLDYELPPEIEGAIPKGLPDDLIMTHGARVFFRDQCTRAEELMRAVAWRWRFTRAIR